MACKKSKADKNKQNILIDIDTCRICTKKSKDRKSLFHSDDNNYVEEIQFCTGILIIENPTLPSTLCQDCLTQLNIAHNFKTTCINSENEFQELLKNAKIEIKCEDFNQGNEISVKEEIDYLYDDVLEDFMVTELDIKKSPKKPKVKKPKPNKGEGKFRRLYCSTCELPFKTRHESLEHYQLLHKTDWVCEVCGKQFVHQASLHTHVKAHGPPKHACALCDYCTVYKSDLTKHMRIHTGEKKYQCHYCTGVFRTSSNLTGHIERNHGGEKKHSCDKCDKKFYARHKLNRHLDSHNNVKRFECEVCHSCFTRRCHWRAHLQKQHAVNTPRVRPGRRRENVSKLEINVSK